jgi:hypothetical protein
MQRKPEGLPQSIGGADQGDVARKEQTSLKAPFSAETTTGSHAMLGVG